DSLLGRTPSHPVKAKRPANEHSGPAVMDSPSKTKVFSEDLCFFEYDRENDTLYGYFDLEKVEHFENQCIARTYDREDDHDVWTWPNFWEVGLHPEYAIVKFIRMDRYLVYPGDTEE